MSIMVVSIRQDKSKANWFKAGHGFACSEPNIWDDFGVYEKPMKKQFAFLQNL